MRPIDPLVVQDIRRAREDEGLTLTQLVSRFQVSKTSIFHYIQGCDSSKVLLASPSRCVVQKTQPIERPPLSTGDIGEAARQMICARLLFAGIQVFRPLCEDTPIDLLVLKKNGEALRCQCKYIYPNKQGCHKFRFCALRTTGGVKRYNHIYTESEIDLFLGYCQDNDSVYVLPRDKTGGRKEAILWILREPQGANLKGVFDHLPWRNAFHLLR